MFTWRKKKDDQNSWKSIRNWETANRKDVQEGIGWSEFVDSDQPIFYYPASATTFSAASFIPEAVVKFKPDSSITLRPSSTFVPSSLTTTGTLMPMFLAAATTPLATMSVRTMP